MVASKVACCTPVSVTSPIGGTAIAAIALPVSRQQRSDAQGTDILKKRDPSRPCFQETSMNTTHAAHRILGSFAFKCLAGAMAALLAFATLPASAAYPEKPVKFIHAYPGSPIDSAMRFIADRLSAV